MSVKNHVHDKIKLNIWIGIKNLCNFKERNALEIPHSSKVMVILSFQVFKKCQTGLFQPLNKLFLLRK